MKKSLLIPLGLAVLTIGVLVYNEIPPMESKTPVVESHASWVKFYSDISSLVQDADVIAQGEVQAIHTFARYDQTDIATDVSFRIIKLYKGADAKSREQITVVQDGGVYNGVTYKLDKVEIMEPGKKYLLFLKYAPDVDKYAVLTGWQGQFKLGAITAENPEPSRSMEKAILEKEIAKFKN